MRAGIGISMSLALSLGLFLPRTVDRSHAEISDGVRTASTRTVNSCELAVGPVTRTSGPMPRPAAETLPESERLDRELLHTDRLIAVLRPKILRSGNGNAQKHLAEAMKREREAREARAGSQFARATRLTREAQSLAREAAAMVGPPEEDPAYVLRAIDRAADAFDLAEDVLERGANPGVWMRFNGIKNELTEARKRYKEGAMRRAYKGASAVRDGVLDLLKDCENLPVPAVTASKALKRAEWELAQAEKEIGANPIVSAQRWQREAFGQMTKARSAFARRDYRDAVIHSKLVERNLEQAMSAQRGGTKRAA